MMKINLVDNVALISYQDLKILVDLIVRSRMAINSLLNQALISNNQMILLLWSSVFLV